MLRYLVGAAALVLAAVDLHAEDWPHWRGPQRTGITTEGSGWTEKDGAPWLNRAPIWKANSGSGGSSPLVIGDHVYLIGWAKDQDTLRCLDLKTGKPHWEKSYPAPKYGRHAVGDQVYFQGVTATPEYDPVSKRLFTLGCDGQLCAWNLEGKSLWQLNLYDRFGMERRPQITKRKNTRRDYGYTTAPLAFGDHVIVEVGDPKTGNLMAFRQSDGKLAWTSENHDVAGHSGGPNLLTVDGVPCAVIATSYHLLVTRLDGDRAGESVAEFPWPTDFSNTISSAAPDQASQSVLISSRYNHNAMARVAISLDKGATEVWRNRYPSGVCTPVIHKDHIYFANKGLWCIDFATGKLVWEGGRVSDAGSCLVTADDRLLVWANAGDLSLADTVVHSPKKCHILSEKQGILKDMAWPHLVLANGHLLVKTVNGDVLSFAVDES